MHYKIENLELEKVVQWDSGYCNNLFDDSVVWFRFWYKDRRPIWKSKKIKVSSYSEANMIHNILKKYLFNKKCGYYNFTK